MMKREELKTHSFNESIPIIESSFNKTLSLGAESYKSKIETLEKELRTLKNEY